MGKKTLRGMLTNVRKQTIFNPLGTYIRKIVFINVKAFG